MRHSPGLCPRDQAVSDFLTYCERDGRRECVSHLPVGVSFPSAEPPIRGETLQQRNHLILRNLENRQDVQQAALVATAVRE